MTPDEEERVREQLRRSRVTEPMPDEVAARIEDTLAGVADGDAEGTAPAADVPRVDHRRRQIAGGLLAAAVAAVVAGVGLAQLLGSGPATDGESAASRPGGSVTTRPDTGADPERGAAESGDASAGDSALDGLGSLRNQAEVPRIYLLQPGRFRADVTRVRTEVFAMALDSVPAEEPGADAPRQSGTLDSRPGARENRANGLNATGCAPEAGPADVRLRVRYGGRPGVLLLRPVRGETQRVDLYLCTTLAAGNRSGSGEPEPDRSVRLPTP